MKKYKEKAKNFLEKLIKCLLVIPGLILLILLFPESVPGIIIGIVGGIFTGIIAFFALLVAKVPTSIALGIAGGTVLAVFLFHYLPTRRKGGNEKENSLLISEK